MLPVNLAYTERGRGSSVLGSRPRAVSLDITEVLSIRGDVRDLVAAKRMFPAAAIRMTGWIPFIARRVAPVDWVVRALNGPVTNRYRAWAALAGVPFETVMSRYGTSRAAAPRTGRVLVHIGALWRSRQYPYTVDLATLLAKHGLLVELLAGPSDTLPPGVAEHQVRRVLDGALVEHLRGAEFVITNDSGPMHLAAFLGCRTVAVARVANVDEWLPPGALAVRAEDLPQGYRPHRAYKTDDVLSGWPSPEQVVNALSGI